MNPHWQKSLFNVPFQEEDFSFDEGQTFSDLVDIAHLITHSKWLTAEASLLANFQKYPKEALSLIAFISLSTRNFSRLNRLIPNLYKEYSEDSFVKGLIVLWTLTTGNKSQLGVLPSSFWKGEQECPYLLYAHGHWLLSNGDLEECQSLINTSYNARSLEKDILLSKIYTFQREYRKVIEILKPWLTYKVSNSDYWRTFLNAHFQLQDGNNLKSFIDQALQQVPSPEELFDYSGWGLLLNKMPAQARQAFLKQRLLGWNLLDPLLVAHLYNSHELLGETENLIYIHNHISKAPVKYLDVYSNLLVHLTSLESDLVMETSAKLMSAIKVTPGFDLHNPQVSLTPKKRNNKPLKVIWVTGDCRYHPVSRFLLGILDSYAGNFAHEHLLVSTATLEDEIPDRFRDIKGVTVQDFSSIKAHYLTHEIRSLDADIAIDLSGWTHNHCAPCFISRVAPVQVNYLGYYGSTGIPSMDWWLGDSNLFPLNMQQWHSEKIYRMSRCFIAWAPHDALPEARAIVSEAKSGPIRFGCFNHLRKLSDLTLQTWADILSAIPSSRLVLKACGFEDPMTISLLQRRIKRAGLDLERIDFLPFTNTVSEHLAQYKFVDIALDPFPNGGCTTTAEALWMGVPVITLKGASYVSRMSTAVLRGAKMNEWIANDLINYKKLALEHASDIADLRRNRIFWRNQLVDSPLGDTFDLCKTLEETFLEMHQHYLDNS